MSDSNFDIEKLATLARLELTENEKQEMNGQLTKIIEYVNKLDSLDVSNVEATSHPFPMDNVVREDILGESLDNQDALLNAPKKHNGLFIVPKIVE